MFDIGFLEILVIGVLALLVLGPERLPGAMKSCISTIRSIKDMANGFKQEVSSQLDMHELHSNLKKAEQMGMENISPELKASVDELKAAAESVQRPYKKQAPSSKESPAIEPVVSNTIGDEKNQASEAPNNASSQTPDALNKPSQLKQDKHE